MPCVIQLVRDPHKRGRRSDRRKEQCDGGFFSKCEARKMETLERSRGLGGGARRCWVWTVRTELKAFAASATTYKKTCHSHTLPGRKLAPRTVFDRRSSLVRSGFEYLKKIVERCAVFNLALVMKLRHTVPRAWLSRSGISRQE